MTPKKGTTAMKRLSLLGLVVSMLVCGAGSAPADEPSVSGAWNASYTGTAGDSLRFYMTLKQDGELVTGTLTNPGYGGSPRVVDRPVTGTFKDGVLKIGSMEATIAENTMKGTMRSAVGGQLLYFNATREK
jgi:hypothetical protein